MNFIKLNIYICLLIFHHLGRHLDEATRDAFHNYIEERGIDENLFPFLQAWLYLKYHRNLMRYFRTVAKLINGSEMSKATEDSAPAAGESMTAKGA